jgi:uncharacterized caspase-like protein
MAIEYQPRYQNSWALVVGINAYKHLPPLSYAGNDADAIAAVLQNELGFPADHISVLKDHDATKQEILRAYLSFEKKASHPDDRVLVFFAGHGTTKEGHHGPMGFLVPFDGHVDDSSSLIPWYDFTRNADLILAKHILFIMDACYGGLATTRAVTPGQQRFLSDMLQRRARQVITAGKADQVVADGGGPQGTNSLFTGFLLEGLRGAAANKDGILTASNLMHYVIEKVGHHIDSAQTPHYGHIDGDGDFILRTPNQEHLQSQTPSSDFLVETVLQAPQSLLPVTIPAVVPSFAEKSGYGDPDYPGFGRNDWTERLGELRGRSSRELHRWDREVSRAFSWLSLIVEPIANQPILIDIAIAAERLPTLQHKGDKPYELWRLLLPRKIMTTIDSVVLFDKWDDSPEFWTRYLRLNDRSSIEYAVSDIDVFVELDGIRRFAYVEIIGIVWQFLFLAKRLLTDAEYMAGVRFLVSLVGTRDSFLGDFAKGPGEDGKAWEEPPFWTAQRSGSWREWKCSNRSLQMGYDVVIGTLKEEEARKVVDRVAGKLGLAYNHPRSSPRCFNRDTDVFPWNQYFDRRR